MKEAGAASMSFTIDPLYNASRGQVVCQAADLTATRNINAHIRNSEASNGSDNAVPQPPNRKQSRPSFVFDPRIEVI
ncbi:hypothetical protein ACOSP7_010982 [Xanthoceras sorbifolium]